MFAIVGGWNGSRDLPSKATTIFSAFHYDDPLEAAIETLWVARDVFGPGRAREFEGELWQAFPAIRNLRG
jgi:hypothetical protein